MRAIVLLLALALAEPSRLIKGEAEVRGLDDWEMSGFLERYWSVRKGQNQTDVEPGLLGQTCGDSCASKTDGSCDGSCDCRWCWPDGGSWNDPNAGCKCAGGGGGGDASTTRYWDCNQPFCEPGNLPYPHQYRMFKMSDGRLFGHAAASDVILQGHAACEKCYELSYGGTKIVAKVDNWCPCDSNPPGCCEPHFDLAVPGTDYAAASVSNVCQSADTTMRYDKGRQSCAHWPWEDSGDCCNSVSYDGQLNDACNLFINEVGWDNPRVSYKEVSCPYESVLMEEYNNYMKKMGY